jgi:hypothetical protein
VHAVTDTGCPLSAAARKSGLNRRTVGKYARAATRQDCVRRTRPHQPTSLDPYPEYLRRRWEEGEHTATVLHQEIAAKGYRGHYQRVKTAIAPLRRGLPIDTPRERPPPPREVARWITTAPSRRSLHAAEALRRLFEHCPELNRTHDLVRQFAAMLETRDATPLPDWLDQLAASRLPALAGLAKAIREDQPAVVQGITTSFNSGANEGRITDLKLQKTVLAGRAAVPLLRHRVILMALLRRRHPRRSATGAWWHTLPSRKSCQGHVHMYADTTPRRRPPNGKLTPTERTVNRALFAARTPVEHGVARLKSWRIFRRERCSPTRLTSITAAILTLERQR